MQLDPVQVTRAARELGDAVDHIVAARRIEVPAIFGRFSASREVGQHVRSALAGTRAAHDALAPGAGPFRDALAAVEELARGLEGVGRSQYELNELTRGERWSTVFQLRGQLDTTAALLAVPDHELLGAVADARAKLLEITRPDWRFIEAVADLRRDDLGAAAPYLSQIRGNYEGEQAAATILRDPVAGHASAWQRLARAATQRETSAAVLRDAFTFATRELAGVDEARMPAWLRALPDDAKVTLTEAQSVELQLLGRAGNRSDVVAQVLETLTMSEPNTRTIALLRAAERLDDDLRVTVPLAADAPRLEEFLDPSTTRGVVAGSHRFLRDAYVQLATESDDVLRREVARLEAAEPSLGLDVQLARLGVERPDVLLGPSGARADWMLPYLSQALEPYTGSIAAKARPAAYQLLRRTDADRALVFAEYRRLAAAPDMKELPADLREVAVAFTAMPDALRPRATSAIQPLLMKMFPRTRYAFSERLGPEQLERGRDAIRLVLEADARAVDPATTRSAVRAELDELLQAPDIDLDGATLRRLVMLDALPEQVRPASQRPHQLLRRWAGTDAGTLATTANLVDWTRMLREAELLAEAPGTTRSSTAAELRRLLDMPDADRTQDDARRMLVLLHLPSELAPVEQVSVRLRALLERTARIGDPLREATGPAPLDAGTREELGNLRLAFERTELLERGTSPSDVREELRTLLDRPDAEIDAAALRRIAVLDGLPAAARGVGRPDGAASIAASWTPGAASTDHTASLGMLRLALEAGEEAARSGTTTRASVASELTLLLSRANDQLDETQQRRIALLASMPDELRPSLPTPARVKALPVAFHEAGGFMSDGGRAALDAARAALLPTADLSVDELVAMARQADGSIRLDALAPAARIALTEASASDWERLGVRPISLLRDVMENTRASGDKERVSNAVRVGYALASRLPEPATSGERHVLERLRATLQRNRDRVDHRLRDGYSNYPDYAEHGRAIEDAVLLGRIDDLRRSQAAPAAAASTGEQLTW
ncbi:MAG: hypothetical protein JWL76_1158 [Thermoleophilia bacterium]|nr:hypothetical protein [Thermoleophilia bacterium]